MIGRAVQLFGLGTALVAGLAFQAFLVAPLSGQRNDAPRTPWGTPDLQGTWSSNYQVPLQRAARDAGKELLSDEEMAQRDQEGSVQVFRGARIAERGTLVDLMGAYDAQFEPTDRKPTGRRTSLIVDPANGRMPAYTAAVQKRLQEMRDYQLALLQSVEICKTSQEIACYGVKPGPISPRRNEPPPHYLAALIMGERVMNRNDGPEDFSLNERCLGGTVPNFGGVYRIVQSPDAIVLQYEGYQRVIPITNRPHAPAHVRLWRGDSRARWEGNTLVVDVTNFTPKSDFQGSRENLHLIERFTRTGPQTLEYVVTMDDPTTWAAPWTVKVDLDLQDRKAYLLYDEPRCQDGNYALTDMLRGARSDDKAFAEGRGPNPATMCYLICGGRCSPGRPGCDQ